MSEIEQRIGYRFSTPILLEQALRHASLGEVDDGKMSYQRLEFLGDAVLNLCMAQELFKRMPKAGEGELSKARASLINNRCLVRVGERIGVPESLRTDPSLRRKGGSGVTRKMVADAVEAIVGAIFLDGGYAKACEFILFNFMTGHSEGLSAEFDAKSRLQEWCQKRKISLPEYRLHEVAGPAHSRVFTVIARMADGTETTGSGSTKKEAEMEAAERLLLLVTTGESPL